MSKSAREYAEEVAEHVAHVDAIEQAILAYAKKREEGLLELIDAASVVVEIWAVNSESQKTWKKDWLIAAKEALSAYNQQKEK